MAPANWTVEQVYQFLLTTDLRHDAGIFNNEEVDGSTLLLLTEKHAEELLKLTAAQSLN
jgi:hypothetical protein